MAQLQTLILKDRKSTPVNHTFVPRSVIDGVGTVVENGSVAMGEQQLSVSKRKTPSGRQKTVVKLALPVVATETINGVPRPVVIDTDYATITFDFGPTSTAARRTDVQGMVEDAMKADKALIFASVVNLETVWG